MKHMIALIFAAVLLFCLPACGSEEDSAPYVALTDVAAESVPAEGIAPADVNEVAIASEEMILPMAEAQPMDGAPESAFAEPYENAAAPEAETEADTQEEE